MVFPSDCQAPSTRSFPLFPCFPPSMALPERPFETFSWQWPSTRSNYGKAPPCVHSQGAFSPLAKGISISWCHYSPSRGLWARSDRVARGNRSPRRSQPPWGNRRSSSQGAGRKSLIIEVNSRRSSRHIRPLRNWSCFVTWGTSIIFSPSAKRAPCRPSKNTNAFLVHMIPQVVRPYWLYTDARQPPYRWLTWIVEKSTSKRHQI